MNIVKYDLNQFAEGYIYWGFYKTIVPEFYITR